MALQISDLFLTSLSNGLGALAVLLIILYQFLEVNAKRQAEVTTTGTGAVGEKEAEQVGFDE